MIVSGTPLSAQAGISAAGSVNAGAGLIAPAQVSEWFVDHYRRTEGDVSSFMLAPHSFRDIPQKYRPGSIIEITGVKIPKEKLPLELKNQNMPDDVRAITEAGDDAIFWLHPMACVAPPDLPPGIPDGRDVQRDNDVAYAHISKLLQKYPAIKGQAVVSSSVRTVLLYQSDGKQLDTPYELKLHLPVFINDFNRRMTVSEIGKVWVRHRASKDAAPLHYASGFEESYTVPDFIFEGVGAKTPRYSDASFGFIVRDAGFKIEDGRVHFQIPYFSILGGRGQSLALRLFNNLKARYPRLTPHDFVVDYLIAPYIAGALGDMKERGAREGGFHYQNPVLKISTPVGALDINDPFAWADDPELAIEGAITKEISSFKMDFYQRSQEEMIGTLVSNLWYYFATEMNWACAFPDFDRPAFRKKILSLLGTCSPSDEPPSGVDIRLWEIYRFHYGRIMRGLANPATALENEVLPLAGRKSYGMAFTFVLGSVLQVHAPARMESESEAGFTLLYDKLAYLTVAYPEADIHEMAARENGLYAAAKDKAAKDGITREEDPVSFLRYIIDEVYSPPEIERLRIATEKHAGLADFGNPDRKWLADIIFDPEKGLFQRQLAAYLNLKPGQKKRVQIGQLPRAGFWFRPIAREMILARGRDAAAQEIGACLATSRDFTKLIEGMSAYYKEPFLKRLAAAVFGR